MLNGALQIANGEGSVILRILPVFEELHDDVRATLIPQLLPAINDVSVRALCAISHYPLRPTAPGQRPP